MSKTFKRTINVELPVDETVELLTDPEFQAAKEKAQGALDASFRETSRDEHRLVAELHVTQYARGKTGVDRSRTDEVSVVGLYLVTGGVAPVPVKRWLLGLLALQVVVALVAAVVQPFTALAFGILVPMFGLAITGRWAAEYGAFDSRAVLRTKRTVTRSQRPADEEGSSRA